MKSRRLAPVLLATLLLAPACDRKDEPEVDPAAKLASDLEEAETRVRNHKLEDAEKLYARILEEYPDNADALAGMGQVRLEEKNLAEAETLLGKAAAKKADDAKIHAQLGQVLALADKHAEAAEAYGKAWEINGEKSDYGLAYGRELNKVGKHAEAEKVLREVAELDPKVEFVFTQLGDALRGQEKHDEALRTYMKAQTTHASDKMAYAGAALVYEIQGDNKHALDEWSMYIRMDCCSEYSKGVAQAKVEELSAPEGGEAEGEGEAEAEAEGDAKEEG